MTAKTPPALINRLQDEMARVVQLPEIMEMWLTQAPAADAIGRQREQLDKIGCNKAKKQAGLSKTKGGLQSGLTLQF